MVYEITLKVNGSYRTSARGGAEELWDQYNEVDLGSLEDPTARIDMEEEDENGVTCADVFVKGTYTTSVGASCREEAVSAACEMAEDQEFGPLKGVAFIVKDVEPFPECLPF